QRNIPLACWPPAGRLRSTFALPPPPTSPQHAVRATVDDGHRRTGGTVAEKAQHHRTLFCDRGFSPALLFFANHNTRCTFGFFDSSGSFCFFDATSCGGLSKYIMRKRANPLVA